MKLLTLAALEPAELPQARAESPAHHRELREWTAAIRAGDAAAFTTFYEQYSLRLYKYLLVLAQGDERVAREVLQTTVLKLVRSFSVFDEEERLWAWLCRVARNAYIDFCRIRQREQRFVPLPEQAMELPEAHDEHRLSISLQHALELLPDNDRELLRAAYIDECPLQELAQTTGQTYKALESRLSRLRQKVKLNLLQHLRHETGS